MNWILDGQSFNFVLQNKQVPLNSEDEIFIACSPRVVRRRLGSLSDQANNNLQSPDQLTVPSPDTTPNGSLRRRRSRVPSDEDESGLMDFLRSSGTEASRERRPEQYGSLDRSWSRKARRRPNLMDYLNDERERPVSPATGHGDHHNNPTVQIDSCGPDNKSEEPKSTTREWRERIAAWFVDLENGGSGEIPKKRPPPRRFIRRFGEPREVVVGSRGLATLPEGTGAEEAHEPVFSTYQRVYPDRRPSLKLNTDVVGAMEAIEGKPSIGTRIEFIIVTDEFETECQFTISLCRSTKPNEGTASCEEVDRVPQQHAQHLQQGLAAES